MHMHTVVITRLTLPRQIPRVVWRTCSRSNVDVARTGQERKVDRGEPRRSKRRRRDRRCTASSFLDSRRRLTLSRLETMACIHVAVRIVVLDLPVPLLFSVSATCQVNNYRSRKRDTARESLHRMVRDYRSCISII